LYADEPESSPASAEDQVETGSFKPVVLITNLFIGTHEHAPDPEPDVVRRFSAIREEAPAKAEVPRTKEHSNDEKWIPIWTDRVPAEKPAGRTFKNVIAVAIPVADSPTI
jgi:hypothetical protein